MTGVQTCALPISPCRRGVGLSARGSQQRPLFSPLTAGLARRGGLSRCRASPADARLGSLLPWGALNSATWAYIPVCGGGAGVSLLEPWWPGPGPAGPGGVFEGEHFHGHGSIPLPVFTRVGSLQPHKPGGDVRLESGSLNTWAVAAFLLLHPPLSPLSP